jgi:hypothetical protein
VNDPPVGPEPRWWRIVERELERHAADADWSGVEVDSATELPDPWADIVPPAAELTPAQRAVLAGFDDQPWVPHLLGVDGDATADQPPTSRLAAHEGEEGIDGDEEVNPDAGGEPEDGHGPAGRAGR